jgi:transcriptional regulator with XRE-family HTH domain
LIERKTIHIIRLQKEVKILGLKEKRISSGFTQDDVAKRLNTTRVTVARWESGIHEPGVATLKTLAQLYRCSIDDLLDSVNPTRPRPKPGKAKAKAKVPVA